MPLIDEIRKIAKEGSDLSGIEKMIGDLDPLKNISTKEDALSFIDRNSTFKAALDHETTKRVDNALEKFKTDKLPAMIEEKVKEATKPKDETPEQKRIRELEEKLGKREASDKLEERKAALRIKAKEIGYDVLQAEKFAAFGDDAEKELESAAEFLKANIEAKISEEKRTWIKGGPKGGDTPPATKRQELIDKYNEIEKSNDMDKGAKLIALKDQIAQIPKE